MYSFIFLDQCCCIPFTSSYHLKEGLQKNSQEGGGYRAAKYVSRDRASFGPPLIISNGHFCDPPTISELRTCLTACLADNWKKPLLHTSLFSAKWCPLFRMYSCIFISPHWHFSHLNLKYHNWLDGIRRSRSSTPL